MRENVLVQVRIAPTSNVYEFRVPLDLTSRQVAWLMSQVLAAREPELYVAHADPMLMTLEDPDAGILIEGTRTIRALVADGRLADGSLLALV